jgi:molecular chaperone DnaK (HSP70)
MHRFRAAIIIVLGLISALILRELVSWAERSLGQRPQKAVITVPAYVSAVPRYVSAAP